MAERRAHRARWVGALASAAPPLALVIGRLDPVSGAHVLPAFRAAAPHARVVEMPHAGHYPQLEAPRAVVEAHAAWLAAPEREDRSPADRSGGS